MGEWKGGHGWLQFQAKPRPKRWSDESGRGYKSSTMGTAANNVEDRNVHRTPRHKGESYEACRRDVIPRASRIGAKGDRCDTDIERCREVYAEVSRGHMQLPVWAEGQNNDSCKQAAGIPGSSMNAEFCGTPIPMRTCGCKALA